MSVCFNVNVPAMPCSPMGMRASRRCAWQSAGALDGTDAPPRQSHRARFKANTPAISCSRLGMRVSRRCAWERAGARVPTNAPRRQSYLACLDATSVRVSCLTAQGPRGAQPVPASSSPTSRPHATPDAHAGRSLNRDPCPAPARLHGHAKVAVSAPFATARAYDPSPRSKVEVPIDPSRAADASGALSGG